MRRHQHKIFAAGFIVVLVFGVGTWEEQERREADRDAKIGYLIELHSDAHEREFDSTRRTHDQIERTQLEISIGLQKIEAKLDALHEKVEDRTDMAEYERGWDEAMDACHDDDAYQEPPC
jgi:hypothetical protein